MLNTLHNSLFTGSGGQVAICSAHPRVLMAAADLTRKDGALLLVEATINQINLTGGYTGMTPADFAGYMAHLAAENGLDGKQLALGADHLGPHPWRHMPADDAMARAKALARAFAAAGYQKLHLDTGMRCTDDPPGRLPMEIAAQRAAELCKAAESAVQDTRSPLPLYVIGTEAPAPGGALNGEEQIAVTEPQALLAELDQYRKAFRCANVGQAWERVMAVVVQPGVDFGDEKVAIYKPEAAAALSECHNRLPGSITFEIHATDYQPPAALKQLVRDGFNLLKIGPCLTLALRETLFSLAQIENALPNLAHRSNLIDIMDKLMRSHPEHWQGHYHGSEDELIYLRRYSLRDRIRYYWAHDKARQACDLLLSNLARPISKNLVRQFLPDLFDAIDNGELAPIPEAVIQARIQSAMRPYAEACQP